MLIINYSPRIMRESENPRSRCREEAEKFPLYPPRDLVVAATPEPDAAAAPEILIGSMDTDVPKAYLF